MQGLDDFRTHHKNKANIVFHILCGMIYTSMLLYLLGPWTIFVYIGILSIMFPRYTPMFVVVLFILYSLSQVYNELKPSLYTITFTALLFYMAPELSHYAVNEKTVLNGQNIGPVTIIENVFMLLPYSIIALSNAQDTKTTPE